MAMRFNERQVLFLISAGLVLVTFIAYEPILHSSFVLFDDPTYVTENPNVTGGITQQSVIWAFTKSYASNWHPLTWLSHMLDCEIYGLKPLGHHVTNLLLHIVNSLLLFWLFQKMTGAIWKSAFVAAAFALHPIHVESVAWISERKDVLSALFWMLTILAYIYYVRKPNFGRYILVLAAFVMGLMSKPMVVTLPFVLVLLDFWPLNRIHNKNTEFRINNEESKESPPNSQFSILNSFYEKIPMFALSVVSSVITFVAQQREKSVISLMVWPLYLRIINAIGCYFNYVVNIIYPKNLSNLYLFPGKMSIDSATLAIMGVVLLLYLYGRGRPWLIVGLLWYLGTLIPVIGLIQVGNQLMADRYMYLPSIGLFIIIAWGAEEIFTKKHLPKTVPAACATAAIIAMTLLTRIQTGYWQDSEKLFTHALSATKNNYIMHDAYGLYLCKQGRCDEGIQHFQDAIRINPNYAPARMNLCQAFMLLNRIDEAINCYIKSIEATTGWSERYKLYAGLGLAYEQKGDFSLAETNYRKALSLNPDFVIAQKRLNSVLHKQDTIPKQ
jgi:hypothetical protein